jgi:orotidine-5'-phosphate decarboxylase
MKTFGARLHAAMRDRGALCAGIDPHPSLLAAWGLGDDVAGLERFAGTCVEAWGSRLAVLKPQSAFFERMGSGGIAVLERLIADARSAGALVLLDAKRGDLGSTMKGYADAYLEQSSPLAVDAITVNPYLGFESLRPMLDAAAENAAGVFVVALTSNPEGAQFQHAATAHGTVAGEVLAAVRAENEGAVPLGSVGAVVGANLARLDEDVDVNGPLLAPGYGVQGGSAETMRRLFGSTYPNVLASTSRGLLTSGPTVKGLREAAARSLAALNVDPSQNCR